MRILIAGVGNVLQADDGFGVEVVRTLHDHDFPEGVMVTETGIGGIALVQDLMLGFDACIIVDAVDRGRPPGTVMVIEPEVTDVHALRPEQRHDLLADMHLATPARAMMVARGLGVLPARLVIVGCQPERIEVLEIGLSDTVRRAIPAAIVEIDRCVSEWREATAAPVATPSTGATPSTAEPACA